VIFRLVVGKGELLGALAVCGEGVDPVGES
jgi:hypothetical protein